MVKVCVSRVRRMAEMQFELVWTAERAYFNTLIFPEHKIKMLEVANANLDKKIKALGLLDPRLTYLKTQVGDLCRKVDIDHKEIVTHGDILEKMMEADKEDEESSE